MAKKEEQFNQLFFFIEIMNKPFGLLSPRRRTAPRAFNSDEVCDNHRVVRAGAKKKNESCLGPACAL